MCPSTDRVVAPMISLIDNLPFRDTIQGHDSGTRHNRVVSPNFLKFAQIFGHYFVLLRDTIRYTKIRVVSLIMSLKSRDTFVFENVSLNFVQGHNSGTPHDSVPNKSIPVNTPRISDVTLQTWYIKSSKILEHCQKFI